MNGTQYGAAFGPFGLARHINTVQPYSLAWAEPSQQVVLASIPTIHFLLHILCLQKISLRAGEAHPRYRY